MGHRLSGRDVDDVDASARACTEAGGKVLVEPRGLAGGRFCVIEDPAEIAPSGVGRIRLRDPEGGGRLVLSTRKQEATRYAAAYSRQRAELARSLRQLGGDLLRLRTDRDPYKAWLQFFQHRGEGRS